MSNIIKINATIELLKEVEVYGVRHPAGRVFVDVQIDDIGQAWLEIGHNNWFPFEPVEYVEK